MLAKPAKASAPDRSAIEDALGRITASSGLQHAESLCQLLRYMVEHAVERPQEHVKEYQIAVDVFGRADSFDPRLDSTVRVQTSRLRNKLIEYYATTGVRDPLVIEIPKGSYSAAFRTKPREPETAAAPIAIVPPLTSPAPSRPAFAVVGVLIGLVIGLAFGVLLFRPPKAGPEVPEIRGFWGNVLKSPDAPLVIFSNAEFHGRPETGLRYFDPSIDSREHINDLYTGVGEVLAMAELSRVFGILNRSIVVKRSGLLSWDETRNRDLIFVGSPTENLSLRDLPLSQDFVFRRMQPGDPRPGDLAIVNLHPRAGEPQWFLASADLPLSEDYALVVLQPGLNPRQSVLLLAGTTTLGTEAAADFVSQNDSLAALHKAMGRYGAFSAVLDVRMARGVPVETHIAALHR